MSLGVLRGVVLVVCVGGIVGMIVGTVASDNNNGVVMTFGIVTAVAVLALIASTMAVKATPPPPDVAPLGAAPVDEALAEQVEARIAAVVAQGASETDVRALVGDAVRLGRTSR